MIDIHKQSEDSTYKKSNEVDQNTQLAGLCMKACIQVSRAHTSSSLGIDIYMCIHTCMHTHENTSSSLGIYTHMCIHIYIHACT